MPLFVLTNQTVTNPQAGDPVSAAAVAHHLEHDQLNNEVAAMGTYFNVAAGTTNLPQLISSATGNPVSMGAAGSDTNISITLTPKGAGVIGFTGAVTAASINVTGLTAGSLLFAGASGALTQDNARAFWDNTNYRLGIRTASPNHALEIAYGNARFDPVSTPGAPTAALAGLGAGNLSNGVYLYLVTFTNGSGESAPSSNASVTVTNSATNGQVALTAIPTDSTGTATGRKIYRTLVGGSTFFLLTTLSNNTATTYTDNTADSSISANASPPAEDTTGGWIMMNTTKALHLGTSNTLAGLSAGTAITSGAANTMVGASAGAAATTGSSNTLVGYQAGYSITTGGTNSLLGFQAGYSLTTGSNNSFAGSQAGYSTVSGASNVYIGTGAGYSATSGNNTAAGYQAGYYNVTGSYNSALGYNAGPGSGSTALGSSIAIGSGAVISASNQLVIGGSSGGSTQITAASLGNGVVNASPLATKLNATGGSGTNIAGASFTLAAGQGTGSAAGGDVILATAPAGSSGTGLNSPKGYITLKSTGSLVLATAALSTSATAGFTYIPSCAGTPTGTPTSFTGTLPLVYDTTHNFLYAYRGGWKKVTLT